MSLRQDLLRSRSPDILVLEKKVVASWPNVAHLVDCDTSDDDLVNVVSLPVTPAQSKPHSRAQSPWRHALPQPDSSFLPERRPLSRDPLRALPTEVSQCIFSYLSVSELANCALVSRKWNKSQTINYVWFQHYRKENFYDNSLPPGKWTKRESKQNWRILYLQSYSNSSLQTERPNLIYRQSGLSSPSSSGRQTPKELREEKWRLEAEAALKPGKIEMRERYKELGGRKSKTKVKVGSAGIRDKGGWEEDPTL